MKAKLKDGILTIEPETTKEHAELGAFARKRMISTKGRPSYFEAFYIDIKLMDR